MADSNDDRERRAAELEALVSFYGEGDGGVQAARSTSSSFSSSSSSPTTADGPWRIRIGGPAHTPVTLELRLPEDYPSTSPPVPILRAPEWVLGAEKVADLVEEMMSMFIPDMEVAILWCEHARAALEECSCREDDAEGGSNETRETGGQGDDDEHDRGGGGVAETPTEKNMAEGEIEGVRTFVPPTSRYGQPIRRFEVSVVSNESNRRPIHRGSPYHPPKSGPSELLVAHVASVQSMDHVNWVLAELLFNDKKVAKATHNMFAYRFRDTNKGCVVSDNDDDGEKGSGMKLAALLEMSGCMDIVVLVSRWFGGVLLGPSRFKYIASVGRDALVEAGHIRGSSCRAGREEEGDTATGKRKGRKG